MFPHFITRGLEQLINEYALPESSSGQWSLISWLQTMLINAQSYWGLGACRGWGRMFPGLEEKIKYDKICDFCHQDLENHGCCAAAFRFFCNKFCFC
jgi:hypothetical protein